MTDTLLLGCALVGLGATHLVYTYVAYPWIVSLLPARPARPRTDAAPQFVSVVIAARDPGAGIAAKVSHLLETVRLKCEIVVVLDGPDSAATAALAPLVGERTKLIVLSTRMGKAVALNDAVAAARGEVLIFTDIRQRVTPGAVERLVGALRSPDVGAVSGRIEGAPPPGQGILLDHYWENEQRLREREAAHDSTIGVAGPLYGMRRDLWRPLPAGLLLDDVWVPMQVVKAGKRVGFDRLAIAIDPPTGSDTVEFVRRVRTLTGNYQLLAWMPWLLDPRKNRVWWQFLSHKVFRLATPLATGLIAAGLLVLAGRWAAWLAGAAAAATLLLWALPVRPTRFPGARILRVFRSGLMLHAALLQAGINAARGRWDVWREPLRPMFQNARRL